MKNIRFGMTFFGLLVAFWGYTQVAMGQAKVQALSRDPIVVNVSIDDHQIYIPASERLDLPAGLSGLMLDQICKTMGYASTVDSQIGFIQISVPTEFAIAVKGDDGKLQFQISKLDPKYGNSVGIVEKLSCRTN
jgi:hypothetical protein